MKVIGVYTIKGGVGKTATAVNLAAEAAASGARTLIWDLDPQGAASFYFRVQPKVRGGAESLVSGRSSPLDHLWETGIPYLDLLPADFSYRNLDILLDDSDQPTRKLRNVMRDLEDDYDVVILDCPPGITLLSENIMRAADVLLVPVVPTTLSLRTLDQLFAFIDGKKLKNLTVLPFLSMVDRRKKLHQDVMKTFHKDVRGALKTSIPNASLIERMGVEQAPVRVFAPSSPIVRSFGDLWREVKRRSA